MTLVDDVARMRRRLVPGKWGRLQFSYARFLDTCSVDEGAVLVDAGEEGLAPTAAESADGTEPFTRLVVELVGQTQGKELRVHIAEGAPGKSAVRCALRGTGLEHRVAWVRRRSRRYMRLLASAALLVGDERSFPFFLAKRRGQRLVCVPEMRRLAPLDRHAISDTELFCSMQHVLLASDWIAHPDAGALRRLADNAMVTRHYTGTYVSAGEEKGEDGKSMPAHLAALLVDGCCDGLSLLAGESLHTGRPCVVLYGDKLVRNGIESSLRNLLASADTSRADFVLMCSPGAYRTAAEALSCDGLEYLNTLPDSIDWIAFRKGRNLRVGEALAWMAHTRFRRSGAWVRRRLDAVFEREARRVLGGLSCDAIVHFTGYDFEFMQMMRSARARRKLVFVHNNMERERAAAANFDPWSLACACAEFDAVCLVDEGLREPLRRVVGTLDDARVFTVRNVCDAKAICAGAQRSLTRDGYGECSCSFAELEALLAGGDGPLFVWLGRFVEQKGCDRLLEAFSSFLLAGGRGRLVMAGSTGELYEQVREAADRIGAEHVAVIRALANPYALLARADALVLASHYEGMPMVVMEALALGKPVICTDMPGVSAFLREGGYGQVVDNSTAGIEAGLVDFAAGRLRSFTRFDVDAFNTRALAEFYAALEL